MAQVTGGNGACATRGLGGLGDGIANAVDYGAEVDCCVEAAEQGDRAHDRAMLEEVVRGEAQPARTLQSLDRVLELLGACLLYTSDAADE